MREAAGAFEVADGEFAGGVGSVVSVGFDHPTAIFGAGVGVGVWFLGVVVLVGFEWSCPAFVDSFRLGGQCSSWGCLGAPFVVGG